MEAAEAAAGARAAEQARVQARLDEMQRALERRAEDLQAAEDEVRERCAGSIDCLTWLHVWQAGAGYTACLASEAAMYDAAGSLLVGHVSMLVCGLCLSESATSLASEVSVWQ